jgi:hypothetical protein
MTGIPAERWPIRSQKLYEQVSARLEARIIDKTYDAGAAEVREGSTL